MKRRIRKLIAFFALVLLVSSLSMLAHDSSWRNQSTITSFATFPGGIEAGARPNPLKSAPSWGNEYWLQWANPTDRSDALLLASGRPFLYSSHPPLPNETQALSGGLETAWIRHYTSDLLPSRDEAAAIAVDAHGNIYVTGQSERSITSLDYLTIKYNSGGVEQWVARYTGPGNDVDKPTAIAVDDLENAYVTGYSFGSGTLTDYVTIKYSADGVERWVARFNGAPNSADVATAIAVTQDSIGSTNVYVTGYSSDEDGNRNYTTIKYNADGAQLWAASYNGVANRSDIATALTVDGEGNVFVTGYSLGEGTCLDYATIKYTSTGAPEWVARYNGPADSTDMATGLAIDDSGNVYVTGKTFDAVSNFDYATIKYNHHGIQQWVARYNGTGNYVDEAHAIAIDDSDAVYITGKSYGGNSSTDYATIKYSSKGKEQWIVRYSSPANDIDEAIALKLDMAGNIYITGKSYGAGTSSDYATIKYDPSGVEQWVARYNDIGNSLDYPTACAVDRDGNAYVTGVATGEPTANGVPDYVTIKYDTAGAQQWVARYDGPGNSLDYASALALDPVSNGRNIYVAGESHRRTGSDYAIVKYDSEGQLLWARRYNRPENGADDVTALAVDGFGNVYVTGKSWNGQTKTKYDFATIKYDPEGEQKWVARYNGKNFFEENLNDEAAAMVVDSARNVYVTGCSSGLYTSCDYVTLKYNSSGVQEWVAKYDGLANDGDVPNGMAVDGSGNVYVTGKSEGLDRQNDYATVKYNREGATNWVARYDGPAHDFDEATALAVDEIGNVYVAGWSWGINTSIDFTTVKYDANGIQHWVARYNGPANQVDEPSAMTLDAAGNIYVIGFSQSAANDADYALVKYDPAGVQEWVARYSGPENANDTPYAIFVDEAANVYVTGASYRHYTQGDYATVKYDRNGTEQWVARYNGPNNSNESSRSIAVDGSGNVYVTGSSYSITWSAFTTIKYCQTTVSAKETVPSRPRRYYLSQNYPNPFNASTTIRYGIAKPGRVSLKVFNLYGQEIATILDLPKPAGEYEIQWNPTNLPSGVYVYRLQAGEFVGTKKLVLVR